MPRMPLSAETAPWTAAEDYAFDILLKRRVVFEKTMRDVDACNSLTPKGSDQFTVGATLEELLCRGEASLDQEINQKILKYRKIARERRPYLYLPKDPEILARERKHREAMHLPVDDKAAIPYLIDPRKEKQRERRKQTMDQLRRLPGSWIEYYNYDIKAKSISHGPSPVSSIRSQPSKDHPSENIEDESSSSPTSSTRSHPSGDHPSPDVNQFGPTATQSNNTHSPASTAYLDDASILAAAVRDSFDRVAEARAKMNQTPPTKKPSKLKKWRVKLANMKQKVCDTAEDLGIAIIRGLLPALYHGSLRVLEDLLDGVTDISHWLSGLVFRIRTHGEIDKVNKFSNSLATLVAALIGALSGLLNAIIEWLSGNVA